MRSLMTLLSGASLGASGMYLMDPDRGGRVLAAGYQQGLALGR